VLFTDIDAQKLDTAALCAILVPLLHADTASVRAFASTHTIMQLLQHLKTQEFLSFSDETCSWKWDINVIKLKVSDNPTEIID
jgi:hypothetical protein